MIDHTTTSAPTPLEWLDYVVILGSLLVCVWIGLRKDKTREKSESETIDYVMGGRNMAMLPVALSMMATLMSGNSITGGIGESYRYGHLNNFFAISGLIAKILVAYLIVPVFHYIRYVSIYEYIENRLDRSFRYLFSGLYILSHLVYLGIALYGPALSLTSVSGIPYWINVSFIGLVCAFYCVMGGLKAIIWTDVFQAGLMFFCVLTIIVKGTMDAGGIGVVFDRTYKPEGVLDMYPTISEDPAYRYSLTAVFFGGIVETLRSAVVGQAGAQRLLCVKNAKVAQKSLIIGAVLMLFFKVLVSMAAMAVYANFYTCDPLQRPETGVYTEDQIFIFAVSKFVASIQGLQGLALAGLISATLSTCSSFINAFAAITLEDFAKPFFPNWTKDDKAQVIICKLSTLVYAILAVALSFATPYLGGAVKAFQGFISSLTGPLCGVMVLALFFTKANINALKVAFIVSLVFVLWITTGNLMHDHTKSITMPLSVYNCTLYNNDFTNYVEDLKDSQSFESTATYNNSIYFKDAILINSTTSKNISTSYINSYWNNNNTLRNGTITNNNTSQTEGNSTTTGYIFLLYRISFMWYGPIGMAFTCLIGIVLTYVLGPQPCTDYRLLSPLVTRGWKKPELEKVPELVELWQPSLKWPLIIPEQSV